MTIADKIKEMLLNQEIGMLNALKKCSNVPLIVMEHKEKRVAELKAGRKLPGEIRGKNKKYLEQKYTSHEESEKKKIYAIFAIEDQKFTHLQMSVNAYGNWQFKEVCRYVNNKGVFVYT